MFIFTFCDAYYLQILGNRCVLTPQYGVCDYYAMLTFPPLFSTHGLVNQMFVINKEALAKHFVDGLACELLRFGSSWLHWGMANWLRPPLKCQTED